MVCKAMCSTTARAWMSYRQDGNVFPGYQCILSWSREMRLRWFNAVAKMLGGYKAEGSEHRGHPQERQHGTLHTSPMGLEGEQHSVLIEHFQERFGATLGF